MRIRRNVAFSAVFLSAAGIGLAQMAAKPDAAAAQAEKGSVQTLIDEAKASYAMQKQFITAAADAMPEADYGFKATPEVRPFGELVAHVAQVQNVACSIIAGQAPGQPAAPATSKAELVAQLKASFDKCDAANASVNAGNAFDVVGKGFLHGTRVGIIEKNVAHDNEMYGTMSVYLRLKGIVPPSTAARARR